MNFKTGLSKVGGALRGIGGMPDATPANKKKKQEPENKPKSNFAKVLGKAGSVMRGIGNGQ